MVVATNILEVWPRFERRPLVAQVEGGELWVLQRARIFDPLDLDAHLDLMHANPDLICVAALPVVVYKTEVPELLRARHVRSSSNRCFGSFRRLLARSFELDLVWLRRLLLKPVQFHTGSFARLRGRHRHRCRIRNESGGLIDGREKRCVCTP